MDSSRKPVLPNPQRNAFCLSPLLFAWLIPLMWMGSRHGLTTDNLTECMPVDRSAQLGDTLEQEWNQEIERAAKKKRLPKLKYAILRSFSTSIFPEGFLFLIATLTKSILPYLLARLLSLMHDQIPDRNVDTRANDVYSSSFDFFDHIWNDKYVVGGMLGVTSLIFGFFFHHAEMKQRMLGSRIRIACCSLIYRKTLRLSKLSASQTTAGYLVNLLSNDVNRLDMGFMYIHYIWILPIQALLITYLIYLQIGWPAFVGVTALLLKTMPVQTMLSRLQARLRLKVALITDERVGIMNELVQGIQVIKMYAWEPYFGVTVNETRDRELRQIRFASYIRGFNLCTSIFAERTTLFLTILTCALIGQTTMASAVFSMSQFYNVLQLTAAIFYPLALALGGEAIVSIDRIEELLLMQEREIKDTPVLVNTHTSDSKASDKLQDMIPPAHRVENNENAMEILNVTATWDPSTLNQTLNDISFSIKSGSLCAIIGAVGAGKSSILHLILGELTPSSGRVVKADDVTISYASQEPWIFSGTVRHNILFGQVYDPKRYKEVVNCCSLMRDFELFPNGDKTFVSDRGASLSGGQRARIGLARAIYKEATIYLLDDPLSAVDAHVGKHLFEQLIGPGGLLAKRNATRLLVTHQVQLLQMAEQIVIVNEGKIINQGSYVELAKIEPNFANYLERSEDDELDGEEAEQIADRRISITSSIAERKCSKISINTQLSSKEHHPIDENAEQIGSESAIRVCKRYLGFGSSVWQLVYLTVVMIVSQVIICLVDFFLYYWTDREELRQNDLIENDTKFIDIYVYAGILLLVILFVFMRGVMFFHLCVRTSKALHNLMCSNLMGAPMRFFDTNPSGRILNRFSKDLGAVDETLPSAMIEALQVILLITGILFVVSILNPILIGFLAISLVFCVGLLKLYFRTAQDLKRLEGLSRSPVFSHLSASLIGISTIRSCCLEQRLVQEFDGLQDVHSALWRLSTAANAGLGLWLDCISVAFVTCAIYTFILLDEGASSGGMGMVISQAMILTNYVQYGVRQTTIALQQMTNVERVMEYTVLEQENDPHVEPPAEWPTTGNITFTKMSLRYQPQGEATLHDLTLRIKSGWKVGIVGRTGAGKSSLISALFRIAFIDGQIMIDDIDTASISLKSLRSRVSIIPQDPVLFSASIRVNLDPFQQFTDDELWSALGAVELKGAVPSLDFVVTESGANFSIGQRQLVCLARAILRRDKVLVLDEATANVDQQTDALIQRTIRERFVSSTVLTVAHRLRTVMDSDRILVMDAGYISEFDWPHVLLQKDDGVLRSMVKATGQEEDTLLAIAAETYEKYNVSSDVKN